MKYVKWIFVALLISSLTAFVEKDKPAGGLGEGDRAPDFTIKPSSSEVQSAFKLSDQRGRYVVLSFWASYDAASRMKNAQLSHWLRSSHEVEMVSISFDEYLSVFSETVRKDQLDKNLCFVETEGEDSRLFNKYRLEKGFTNYLLDANGVIVAKDLTPSELFRFLKKSEGMS